jgi:para-nitrobenzyl esterase
VHPVVETRSGRIQGLAEPGVDAFRGIPFAAPPVGALRFRPPQPPEAWAGVRDATRFGPPAPQAPSPVMRMLGGQGELGWSEDCLTLNVWTPGADRARRPVLVWIHGGAFTTGSGGFPIYDGSSLARRGDVVVVTINYRLGALGFLALPAFEREEGNVVGNFGLLDQVCALEWVRDNVEAFGGDPGNVTAFGESAGAMSLGALLGTPAARGLFRAAILQSGAAHNVSDPEQGERVAHVFAKELGVEPSDLRRLREAPAGSLLEAQVRSVNALWGQVRGLAFQPVRDGRTLPRPPLEVVRAGGARGVDLLVGTNLDEYKLYRPTDPKVESLDDAALLRRLARVVPGGEPVAERAIETYRLRREGAAASPTELWFAVETDRVFRVPALRLADAQAPHAPRTFTYLFSWASPALGGKLGSCHALELPFVFGTFGLPGLRAFVGDGEEAARLAQRMQDAWLAFARSGDPSQRALGRWPAHDPERRAVQIFGRECRVQERGDDPELRFWDGIL